MPSISHGMITLEFGAKLAPNHEKKLREIPGHQFGGSESHWKPLPSGKLLHNYGKSQFLLGKSTISMVIFNSYVTNYQRVNQPIELAEFLTAIAAGSAAMTRRQRYALTAPLTTLAVLGLCSRPLGQWIYPGIAGKYDIVYDGIYNGGILMG